MRILMVLFDNYYPKDPRVRKEVRTLAREGHRVMVIARKGDGEERRESNDAEIVRVEFPLMRRGGVPYAILYYGLARHSALYWILRLRGWRPHAVHVHDLPAAISSLVAAKLLRLPLIVDMHEDWPELLLFYSKGRSILSKILTYPIYLALKIEERVLLKLADGIITISEEFRDLLVERGADPDKVVVVHNTIDLAEMRALGDVPAPELEGDLKLVYVGGLGPHRDLETVIRGVKLLVDGGVGATLYLVGEGFYRRRLEGLVSELGLGDRVHFTGWLPFREAMGYIKASDLGVIPIADFPEAHISFPNKIQQYMYFSKPLIVAEVRSLSRIVRECGCGFTYRPGDPSSFKRAVMEHLSGLEELGANGRRYLEGFNWAHSSRNLLNLYRKVSNGDS